jgi:hypothetical protein
VIQQIPFEIAFAFADYYTCRISAPPLDFHESRLTLL